ncbi:MAG: insulinase family protein, partial [Rhodospirillales bacterium]|nr:insulinase family protein [Rhodospirillales bacterium]
EAAIDRELDAVLAQGVSAEEVASAIRRLKADAIYVRDSLSAGARILGEALAIGLTVEDVESWPDRIAEVTPDQVQAAAHAVLDSRRSVTALLLTETKPRSEAKPQAEAKQQAEAK